MSFSTAPFKTPSGVDELRSRSRGLGQRHRTVLFLVDGRRSVGEVLGMALKAGAETSHFEELVRLGLVEVPAHTMAPEPQETAPGALDMPKLTSVELDVLLPEIPNAEVFAPVDGPIAVADSELPPAEIPAPVVPLPLPAAVAAPVPAPAPAPATPTRSRSRAAASAPVAPSPVDAPPPHAPPTPVRASRQRKAAEQLADHARPRPAPTDATVQRQVRSLLLGAIGAEAALFAPLTLTRIRNADNERDLIGLVWEIERQRSHLRRSRAQLLSLEKARELLGMGNTLVAGDSQHGGVWPDTQGQA